MYASSLSVIRVHRRSRTELRLAQKEIEGAYPPPSSPTATSRIVVASAGAGISGRLNTGVTLVSLQGPPTTFPSQAGHFSGLGD